MIVIVTLLCCVVAAAVSPCRTTMKEPRGVITTPNFPGPYPVPLSCQWVIEAPSDKVIAVYFTQFYMREGLRAHEYAYFSPQVKMGKVEFGTISSEREPTYLVSNKPVLVLDFAVRDADNLHMRVRDSLLDVFGFNITYEFLSKNESVRRDTCLYHHCSFNGNCFAAAAFDGYYCSCFGKYFGDECQYDAECGPEASKNMCQNGGTCRYYIGATFRTCECPEGYDGARCEAKKIQVPERIECTGSSCNSTCPDGRPSPTDGKKCGEDGKRMRFVISVKLINPKVSNMLSDRKKMETFKSEMERDLALVFKDRLEIYENITVLEVWADATMKFHFLAKMEDTEEVKSTIEQMVKVGKLGTFDFDHDFMDVYSEPALSIERMEASEAMPVAEGSELTLACMVRGSADMRVQWFKDGHPVHVHHSAERSTFTTIVPKNSLDQYTALLGFDRVVALDSGVFTCQVRDWGFVRNRSLSVFVAQAPQPQVIPLTAVVTTGSPLVVTCLALDRRAGYTWLKNGRVLNPSGEPELVEDLFPAGSRILVKEAAVSAVYSCIITGDAGSTRKDSVITVVDKERPIPTCLAEDYLKVRWTKTASNTENIQPCPPGYTGDVHRKCSPDPKGHEAIWEEPDFSGCFSGPFTSLKKKVDSLRLGYLIGDTSSLLSRLKRYLLSKKVKLHFCEGEPIVDVLQDINGIKHGDKRNQDGWTTFLDIASTLLESPILIKKQHKLIQLHNLIFSYGFQYADRINEVTYELFEGKALAVQLGKISSTSKPLLLPNKRFSPVSTHPSPQYNWMTNSIELDFSEMYNDELEANSTASVVAVFYRNLSTHLPLRFFSKKGIADVEYQLISSLVGVQVNGDLSEENISVRVSLTSFNHTVRDKSLGWNISCGMAEYKHGTFHFTTNDCHLIWSMGNNSICQCHRLGTYALLLTHYALPEEKHVEMSFDAIAGSGCAICAFLIIITMTILISLWRKVGGAVTALKLQVCLALLGAFGIFFISFLRPHSEDFFPYTVPLIQFFLLAAFSLQLCLALVVYIQNVDLKNVQYSFTKISALGWTIPVIIVGATLVAQSLEGYEHDGWWLTLGSNFFYAYTSSILILTMFQIMLFVIVKTEIQNYRKVSDYLQSKKNRVSNSRVSILHRSLMLTSSLLFLSMTSILYVNYEKTAYEYLFAISSVIVGFVVLMIYTFCSERHFLLCCYKEKHDQISEREDSDMRSGTDSFKSFLKPEIVDDTYSRKLHVDADKRAERIKRMYTQIEKASDPAPDDHAPIFKPYQHAVGDAFCDPLAADGYPKMHWRYANHPHSPGGRGTKRPLLPDDGSSSCFMQHTDSVETVVHCDDAPLKSIAKDVAPAPSLQPPWNMTSV